MSNNYFVNHINALITH